MITAFGGKQMEKVRKKSIVHVHTYIVDGFLGMERKRSFALLLSTCSHSA